MTICCPTCGVRLEERTRPERQVRAVRLSRTERRIVERLLQNFGAFVATEDLVRAAYPGSDLPGQPALVVAKLAQRARTKLKAVGLTIEGGAGNGGRRLIWQASRDRSGS